ncbi:MAG: MarC family protein [Vicinamibacterales bacterium]
MDSFTRSFLLMFVLLNPFIMSVYLLDLVKALSFGEFARQLSRAALFSFIVLSLFAWSGDRVFENVMQVRFFAFLIFGGVTFLIVGIRLISGLGPAAASLKVEERELAGSIAMPFIIGPGTISAAVLAGSRLDTVRAPLAIFLALAAAVAAILVLKGIHDAARTRHERLLQRYTEIAGRVTALFTGTFAIDMILRGVEAWMATMGQG